MKKCFLAIFAIVFTILNINAQTTDMADLSFEDLLNMDVESSTKTSMSIQKAPSSIKVFNQQDFERYG